MAMFPTFQLLELNIISAQDLSPVSRKMKTYAVAWVNSERKLTTRVDYSGAANPTWNDKFVFRVSDDFIFADTSAVVIEIYALHWFRDVHVGTVRALVSNLIPPERRPGYRSNTDYRRTPPPGMRFIALQVRRPSGRPQGILNIGVGLLDGSMRSMPLYTHMDSSAVGYGDLLGEEDPNLQHWHLNSFKGSSRNPQSPSSKHYQSVVSRPELRRTRSDTSSMVVSDLLSRAERSRLTNKQPISALMSSDGSESMPTASGHDSTTSVSNATKSIDYASPHKTPKIPRQRHDSIESDLTNPLPKENDNVLLPRSERDQLPPYESYDHSRKTSPYESYDHSRKTSPYESYDHSRKTLPYDSYDHSRGTPRRTPMIEKPRPPKDYERSGGASPYLSRHGTPLRSNIVASTPIRSNMVAASPMRSTGVGSTPMRSNILSSTPMRSNPHGSTPVQSNYMGTPMKSSLQFGTPMRSNLAGRPILTESELGPSPSEVATKMAKERSQANDTESSILSEWSLDDSGIEGLRSKLERWRTELPPLYDLGSSHQSSEVNSAVVPDSAKAGGKSSRQKTPAVKKHKRRHTEGGGNGLFSCFSKICGVECTFVCGGDSDTDASKKKGRTGRLTRMASADDLSYL